MGKAYPYNLPMRPNGRKPDELRTLHFKRRYTRQAPGSVLVRMGGTTVLCTCCVELTFRRSCSARARAG